MTRQIVVRLLTAIMLLALTAVFSALPARADTPNCVSHSEFDNMTWGLTPAQVYNRFDVFGFYLGDTDNGEFKRGYDACWTDERRVVVWYSYNTNQSVDWAIRDV
jgi:hypothetical protein